jgi:hypothetical protein
MNIAQAVKSLQPNSEFIIENEDYSTIKWIVVPDTIPTQAEVDVEVIRLQAEYDAQAYARSRKVEYDALNQLEMQFDDKENSTTTWEDAINAIKTKYPKG